MATCLIMCAGTFRELPFSKKPGDLVIAADNGLTYLARQGIVPDLVIGDYDSLGEEGKNAFLAIRERNPDGIITLPVEKDDTDTMACCRVGLSRGYRDFVLLSALGGRLDHTIANIQTLVFLKDHGADGKILDPDLSIRVLRQETFSFTAPCDATFSLFSLDEKIEGVTIEGMQYGVRDATITNGFPIGVSNHLKAGDRASVTVGRGTALAMLTLAKL